MHVTHLEIPTRALRAVAAAKHGLLITLFGLLSACGGSDPSAQAHIALARDYLAAGEHASAHIELKNALQLDGNNAQARLLLGRYYLDGGDILGAEKELELALQAGGQAEDIYPELAVALLRLQKFDEVLALDVAALGASAKARVLSSQALAAWFADQRGQAGQLLESAFEADPGSVQVQLAQARMAVLQGNIPAAFAGLDAVLAAAPENVEAWRVKGQLLHQQQRLEEARVVYDRVLALALNPSRDRLTRALISLEMADLEAARADTAKLLQTSPASPDANYVQGLLLFNDKQYREAISALKLATPAAERFPLALFYLGAAQIIVGGAAEAGESLEQLLLIAPANRRGRKLLAALRLEQGSFDDIRDLLQPVLDYDPADVEALRIMANASLRSGEPDRAVALLVLIIRLQPEAPLLQPPLRAVMGGEITDTASPEATQQQLDRIAEQEDILGILDLLRNNDFERAVAAARIFNRKNFTNLASYHLLAMVYLAAGDSKKAVATLEKALEQDAGYPAANLGLANIALQAGDVDAARKYSRSVLRAHPNHADAMLFQAALEDRVGNQRAMVSVLEQAILARPEVLEARLALGNHYLRAGNADKIASLLEPLVGLQQRALRVMELATRAAREGEDVEQLIAAFDAVIAKHVDHRPALLALALLAERTAERDEFKRYFARLVAVDAAEPHVLHLRAAEARSRGDLVTAAALAERALARAPNSNTLMVATTYQIAAGRSADALLARRQWLEKHPDDLKVSLALAEQLLQQGDLHEAQRQYDHILERYPESVLALNNLAWSLRVDDPERALALINRAVAVSPEQPDLLDTRAYILHLNGRNAQAKKDIDTALQISPDNLSMLYHKALIDAAVGEKDAAIAVLQERLLNSDRDFPEREEARKLLESLGK